MSTKAQVSVILSVLFLAFGISAAEPAMQAEAQHRVRQHDDEVITVVGDMQSAPPTAKPRRSIVAEIEGCKYCQRVDFWQPVYCKFSHMQDFCTMDGSNPFLACHEGNCDLTTHWVPKEIGERRQTLGSTIDVSAMLTVDHVASSTMSQWLTWRLNVPPGYTGNYPYFTPFSHTVEGTSSASESYTTQTWTSTFEGHEVSYQVKIWMCSQSGSACSVTANVTP